MKEHVECPKCRKKVLLSDFFGHLLEHDKERITDTSVICPYCDGRQIEPAFVQHIKDAHADSILSNTENPIQRKNPLKVKCPICMDRVKIRYIVDHIHGGHGPDEDKFYRCAICRNKVYQLKQFVEHMLTHFPELKKELPETEKQLLSVSLDKPDFTLDDFKSEERKNQFKRYIQGFIIYTPMKG